MKARPKSLNSRIYFWDKSVCPASYAMMSPEHLGQLMDRHAAALALFARQFCAAPEDIVQVAFLKLIAQRPSPDRPVAWLYRVVRNEALSAARAWRRRKHHEALAAARDETWFAYSDEDSLDVEAASEALRTLPLEQREVIVAHLWGGLSFEHIGEVTGTSSSTAHRWYLAGLAAIRERLGVPCPPRSTKHPS